MRTVLTPVPVRIVSAPFDLPGWLSFLASVIALVLAVAAIWQTRRQAIAASKQIARERRQVFELEVLRDLLRLDNPDVVLQGAVAALLGALPPADLPLWRTMIASQDRLIRAAQSDRPEEWIAEVDKILDEKGVPPGNWPRRLMQALADDARASIAARVQTA